MARPSTEARLRQFLETAIRLFIGSGYRRTQMADVTDALGLSAGSIYRYLESKEALFDLALRYAVDPDYPVDDILLPYSSPENGSTLAFLAEVLQERARIETLEAALDRDHPDSIRDEVAGIVGEMFAKLSRYRDALTLVERCALDRPELAELWFEQSRAAVIQGLNLYLQKRIVGGHLRPVPDTLASASLFVEIVFFEAVGRHEDPFPSAIDESAAEATALDVITHAFIRGPEPRKG